MPNATPRGEQPLRHLSRREREIEELARKFTNAEIEDDLIRISIQPSDPDFPFDLAYLHFTLLVPTDYPSTAPELTVINTDIPRGYALNVEHGFEDAISKAGLGSMTLVQMISSLDERLEEFLKAEKRETIKLVHVGRRNGNNALSMSITGVRESGSQGSYADWGFDQNAVDSLQISDSPAEKIPVAGSAATYTVAELQNASARREREIRQLHARLPGAKLFSTDEVSGDASFTVPFDPANREAVPMSLRQISTVRLIVPKLYGLVPAGIEFPSIDAVEARAVEANFRVHADHHRDFSLFAHMNFLAQNVTVLATQLPSSPAVDESAENESAVDSRLERSGDDYRKPPEWDMLDDVVEDDAVDYDYDDPNWYVSADDERGRYYGDSHDEDYSSHYSDEDDSVTDTEVEHCARNVSSDQQPPQGISINLSGLQLRDIGVVECTLLSIVVKCVRCKTEAEIRDIKPGHVSGANSLSCAKCSAGISVATFRTELMHENAVRLGYIDLVGCTPTDMLPSSFMPYCGNCSEPLPGTTGIAGLSLAQTMSTSCRSCHTKLSIFIPQVKFSRVSDDQVQVAVATKKRVGARLGIVAGTPLPLNGTCKHYKRSTRWFRFSCCNRVFPCDKCHNEQSDHAEEHASRMICGMCSREQNYQPEVCAYCRHSFFRKNTGFWEGGRGTRDKVKMSRKDPRKYKRPAAQA
ncbi:hypothetical protein POJ06DRAFT_52658 [Lipomyces tetrasporus]|uniref:CHY-type domain-containing protein n=1 Tax=Lipomyces tetrasporus TaxID=54092 RepID=A0AAD7QW62_9ASCO|nr:uncharacterized protein POJ06DRAFT_52658 [Lipomyces tetrasporus]KAJ8102627.1 hypothetical protein POJ06DRAFT_52658 [Lipomyces tetrasporus]